MKKYKENPLGYRPVRKLLPELAIPAIIANLVNAVYNVVDQIFIGQKIGYLGNAATNIAFPLTTICLAIGLMTGIGAASNFNIELGRKNEDEARKIAGTAVSMLIISGLFITILIRLFLEPIMIMFGATEQILDYSMEYTNITSLGIPFLLFGIGTNPLVRADGDSKYSMIAIVTGALMNIVLDYTFMFVLDMGIDGAAWATVISQIIVSLILARYFKNFKSVRFQLEDFIPKLKEYWIIISLGFTSFVFQFSNMIVQVLTNNLLKYHGELSIYGSDIPIAIAGIVIKINIIFTSIIIGLVQGAQPISGFNYGAQKYSRVRETIKLLLKSSAVISLVAFTLIQVFPKQIIGIFGQGNEPYFELGVRYLRIFLVFILLNGMQISISTFFPSIGKAKKGAIISLSKQVIILIPLLLILPNLIGIDGIIFATPISDLLTFIIAVWLLYNELKEMPKEDVID